MNVPDIGNFVGETRHQAMPDIEQRVRVVRLGIEGIGTQAGPAHIGILEGRGQVERMGIGVGNQETQAMGWSFVDADLQRVVIRISETGFLAHRSESVARKTEWVGKSGCCRTALATQFGSAAHKAAPAMVIGFCSTVICSWRPSAPTYPTLSTACAGSSRWMVKL